MQFSINDEPSEQPPDAAFIIQTLEELPEDEEISLALEDDHSYFEADGSRAEGFSFYYDYDDDRTHESLRSAQTIHDVAQIAVLFELFAQGNSGWRDAIAWETPPKPPPPVPTDGIMRLFGWAVILSFLAMLVRVILLVFEIINKDIAMLAYAVVKYSLIFALLVIYLLYVRSFWRETRPALQQRIKADPQIAQANNPALMWIVIALALLGPLVPLYWFISSIFGD